MRRATVVVVTLASLQSFACAPTTYDETRATTAEVAPSTTMPTGSVDELLQRLRSEALALSGVMIDDGDDDAVVERIEALWQAVRGDVAERRDDLVEEFDANVARCAAAVQSRRAADADKAAKNIQALVAAFQA